MVCHGATTLCCNNCPIYAECEIGGSDGHGGWTCAFICHSNHKWTPVHTIPVGISAKLLSQFTWLSPPLSLSLSLPLYSPCPLLLFLFWKVNANARVLYWQSLPLALHWMAVHYLHQHHNPSKRVVGQRNGTMYFEFKLGRHICISTHPLLLPILPLLWIAIIPFANLFCIVGICRFSERNKCAGDSHSNWVETVLLRTLCWGWWRC